jgi:hypothetical protein
VLQERPLAADRELLDAAGDCRGLILNDSDSTLAPPGGGWTGILTGVVASGLVLWTRGGFLIRRGRIVKCDLSTEVGCQVSPIVACISMGCASNVPGDIRFRRGRGDISLRKGERPRAASTAPLLQKTTYALVRRKILQTTERFKRFSFQQPPRVVLLGRSGMPSP